MKTNPIIRGHDETEPELLHLRNQENSDNNEITYMAYPFYNDETFYFQHGHKNWVDNELVITVEPIFSIDPIFSWLL